jgi:IPT/TIG domain
MRPTRTLVRLATLFALVASIVIAAEPAYALTEYPDPTWRTNGKAKAMVEHGGRLYLGGTFTVAKGPGGQSAAVENLAAFDVDTGVYDPGFTATVSSSSGKAVVEALAVSADGQTLYLGGKFDAVNGEPRQNFAAVDAATGTQVDPDVTITPNSKVAVILAGSDLVYLGGNFKRVNGQTRSHLAAISAADGSLSNTWVPSATAGTNPCPAQFPAGTSCGPITDGGTGNVHSFALAPDGNSLFIGGNFFYINGTPRNTIAQVSLTNGSLLSWRVPWATIPGESPSNPYDGPNVSWAILPTTDRVYVGWGRTPNGVSAFNATMTTTGSGECSVGGGCAMRIWNRSTPGNVESLALAANGSRLFVGGHFGTAVLDMHVTSCNPDVWVHGLMSLDPATGGFLCDWFPELYPFRGQNAPGSGPGAENYIGAWTMHLTADYLYVAGWFKTVNDVKQSGFARFTLDGGALPPPPPPTITTFSPSSGPVGTAVEVHGTNLAQTISVAFGQVQATGFTVDSDTQVTAIVPPGFDHAIIKITTPGGLAKSTGMNFKIAAPPAPAPMITTFSPTSGPVGTAVVVEGSGFTGTSAVTFGQIPATSYTVDSDAQITAIVPPGFDHAIIKITAPGGKAKTVGMNFKVT